MEAWVPLCTRLLGQRGRLLGAATVVPAKRGGPIVRERIGHRSPEATRHFHSASGLAPAPFGARLFPCPQ